MNNLLRICLLNVMMFSAFSIYSQDYLFERQYDIGVSVDELQLLNPWAGGINAGQVSRIDLDLDGDLDIFIFDRTSDRILTFINEDPSPGVMQYKFTREYNSTFPAMSEWALLRDFNCDGKVDIFTKAPNSMAVYENISTEESGLQFDLRAPQLIAEHNYSGVPFFASVFCVTIDIPVIEDLDLDGDLDILTFSEIASTIYYYKNYATEIEICDSLAYEMKNRCYGYFAEASENNTIYLGQDCSFNVIAPKRQHTGGTLLSLDTNADGYNELIIGDISYTDLIMLTNGPSVEGPDSMYQMTHNFPAGLGTNQGVDLRNFPAGYYEDVNNDGIRDLIACPNNPNQCEDDSSMVLYLNEGFNNLPSFVFHSYNFLQNTMLEFGRGAHPVVVDVNQDGLYDLVVSNEEYYEEGPQPPSRLALLYNTGTTELPSFELADSNYLAVDQYNLLSVHPSFYDIDNDGDLDMILGDQGGKLHLFRNSAGAGMPFDLELEIPNYTDQNGDEIDVGQFACPQFFDIDNDGDQDLLIGEKNGNINFYQNTGGDENPAFILESDTIGDVVASNYLGINGYAVPYFFKNGNGNTRLLVGTEKGIVNYYGNIDGNVGGSFDLIELSFAGIKEGDRSAVALFDFNNDDIPELLYGQVGGGLAWYQGLDTTNVVPGIADGNRFLFNLYPNPANDYLMIDSDQQYGAITSIEVYDMLGKLVIDLQSNNLPQIVDLRTLPNGSYVCRLRSGEYFGAKEFVIMR